MEGLPAEALMAINCEWGAFDNEHVVLPLTSFDIAIDDASPRKGQQAFEKMVAGLYLGELFRLIMLDVKRRHETFWEGQSVEKMQEPYFMDSSFLSAIEEYVNNLPFMRSPTNPSLGIRRKTSRHRMIYLSQSSEYLQTYRSSSS